MVVFKYQYKKISPVSAAGKLKIPVLLIHSKTDKIVSFKHGLLLQDALSKNPKAKIIFNDNAHGEPIVDYQKRVKKFFDSPSL
jgi:dipeptidyl aminopeptidase/acylaminoacyl peptidase